MIQVVTGSWRTELWVITRLCIVSSLLISSRHTLMVPGDSREPFASSLTDHHTLASQDEGLWYDMGDPESVQAAEDIYETDYDGEYPDGSDQKNPLYALEVPPTRGGASGHPHPEGREMKSRLPQAIIIGVKKGGTRALLEFLRVHPDVRAPGPEVHFFDRHYDKGLEWYRSLMPPTTSEQITIEKTPSYFVTKNAPARVYNMSRSARLIIVVRDPVTRAISDYTQVSTKRRELRTFAEMAFLDNATGPVATSWGAIKIGLYAKHLDRWLHHFPRNQLHFVSGEKLIDDPATVMTHIQDFLGLSRFVTDRHFYFNATKGFPCLLKSERTGTPHCLGKTKGRLHPMVDEKVLQRLRNFYRPFNEKFYEMTGINFEWP